jgi:hypothetical protein
VVNGPCFTAVKLIEMLIFSRDKCDEMEIHVSISWRSFSGTLLGCFLKKRKRKRKEINRVILESGGSERAVFSLQICIY